jgi:ABC-type multidrug transport system fused ATPase/permease subunit
MGMLRLFPYILKSRETIGNVLDIVYKEPNISNTEHEGDNTKPLSIELSNVDFTYPSRPQVQVLNQLNIYIKSGKTIALVGPSGSGKSTVISLIERFYDPNIGAVFLNDDITSNLDITWLRRQISLVSQEPVLFDMSISDNIRYGALFRDVTDDEVIEAAKLANIHNFIVTLPQV